MAVYFEKRTGKYYIKFQHKGLDYQKTLPRDTTKSKAEEYERKWRTDLFLAEMGLVKVKDEKKDILFQDFYIKYFKPYVKDNTPASHWQTVATFKSALPFFQDKTLREIKPLDVEKFKQFQINKRTQHDTVRKPATVARQLAVLSKFFSLAVQNDFADSNPVARVDKPKFDNVSDTVLKREDDDKYFEGFTNKWARDICRFVLHTGLRQNDVLGLKKDAVRLDEKLLILIQGKTQRRVQIPLNKNAMEILENWLDNKTEFVFPSPRSKGQGTSVKRACIKASEKIGYRITIRDLRRTFATRLDENNVPAQTIAALLGQNSLRMVQRYARGKTNLADAVEQLEKPFEK